jgi:signal transduction histidine kinase
MKPEDTRRLKALADYRILDTPPEEVFDNITRIASRIFHTPMVLVTFLDDRRQWFKSVQGLDLLETPIEQSFCDHAVRAGETLVVRDAAQDVRFVDNPLVTDHPKIRFYCGVPLRTPEGVGLGTLCLLDRVPRTMTERGLEGLQALARQVEAELELRRRLILLEESLQVQQRHQQDRELLASMLVHDLRSPLTAVALLAGSMTVLDEPSREAQQEIGLEIDRMRRMLTDVLDLCLQEAGELRLRRIMFALQPLVQEVARRMERQARSRMQAVLLELAPEPLLLDADPQLIERVLENLLANAMHHGPPGRPITLVARASAPGRIRVEVLDEGQAIAPDLCDRLFRPFESFRTAQGSPSHRSHGLGLAFCHRAIEAHGGVIDVVPTDGGGNCFFFELPTDPPSR